MKTVIAVILLVALFFVADAKRIGCHRFCMARVLEKDIKSAELRSCVQTCLNERNHGKDDAVSAIKLVRKFRRNLQRDVQPNLAVQKPEEEAEVSSDSEFQSGATLQATSNLNVRSGPCTDKSIVTTLSQGTTVRFNGGILTACGHRWLEITGTFGKGWASSSFLIQATTTTPTTTPSNGGSSCRVRFNPANFKQCNSQWGSNRLGRDSTICRVGCLMTSVAMALAGLGKTINGQSVTPATFNSFLISNGGYQGNLFIWGSVSRYGLSYLGQPTDRNTIKQHVCNNRVVILNVNNGGHWVLATGVDGDTFLVNDPGSNTKTTYSAREVSRAGVYSF